MSSQPTTPVRVPKAVKTYSPATQDPDLRSQINTVLLRDRHVGRIQETLQHTLSAHPSNWPSKISARALELLRSGEQTTFPALIEQVLQEVRRDTAHARRLDTPGAAMTTTTVAGSRGATEREASDAAQALRASASGLVSLSSHGAARPAPNGHGASTGRTAAGFRGEVNGVGAAVAQRQPGGSETKLDLAVPKSVVDEGIKVTRECLELVCEIDE